MTRAVRVRRSDLLWILPLLLTGACSAYAPTSLPRLPFGHDGLFALSQDYYVVRASAGDTYMGLAWEHNVSPYDVLEINNVEAPYRLEPGEMVRIPAPRIHVVRRGDTLSAIANAYHVDFYDLAQANALNHPFTLYPGQVLRLPSSRLDFRQSRETPVFASREERPSVPRRGETPSPAPRPKPKPEPPSADLPKPRPKPKGMRPGPLDPPLVVAEAAPEPVPQREPKEDSNPEPNLKQPEKPAPQPVEGPVKKPAPAHNRRQQLIWPVRGRIISGFGPTENGRRNDGINIAVPERTPVHAAADGIVIYRGNEVPGFGNLILIRHDDDLVTAYAHASEFMVKKGEIVQKGQKIALSGSTGNVEEPQLHFEVRRGVKAVDPFEHLSA